MKAIILEAKRTNRIIDGKDLIEARDVSGNASPTIALVRKGASLKTIANSVKRAAKNRFPGLVATVVNLDSSFDDIR